MVMRNFIRFIVSVAAGFFLMWPLGYVYGILNWPTFHSWGLLHGGFFSAWPTLSIFTFLMLGYVRFFPRIKDTPLLMIGVVWGLLLTGFLGIRVYLSTPTIYGLLAATAIIVAALTFFATHKLGLALLVVSPIVFFNTEFLLDLLSPLDSNYLFYSARRAFDEVQPLLISTLLGWGLGSFACAILHRRSAAT
jgi:hypothetical protein